MPAITRDVQNQSGFLDGYMAGNISANDTELKFHTEKINSFLQELKSTLNVIDIEAPKKEQVIKGINNLSPVSVQNEPSVDDYYNYSQSLSDVMSQIKNSIPREQLPTESNFLVKRAIYHFLNIAKTLNDKRITDTAVAMASQFK